MASLRDVCETLASTISTTINAAGLTIPSQSLVGWPNAPDLMEIINQGQYQGTVYPLKHAVDATVRRQPKPIAQTTVSVSLTASQSGQSVTYGGSVSAGLNVFVAIAATGNSAVNPYIVQYQTVANDTFTTIATALKNKINALGVSGLSASSSGATLTVSGKTLLNSIITGSATLTNQVARRARQIQVTVWAPSPETRDLVAEAIIEGVGTYDAPWIGPMPDGSHAWVRYQTDVWDDTHQTDYGIYLHHIVYLVEYGVTRKQTITQIGVVSGTVGNSSVVVGG